MRRRYGPECEDREEFSPWETYSDLYCGLLLVFVLLFFFAVYQYVAAREKNNADTEAIQQSMQEEQTSILAIYKADMEDQEAALTAKSDELNGQKAALAVLQTDLDERTALLDHQQTLIDEQKGKLETQQSTLEGQQAQLTEQQAQLTDQKKVIEDQQELLTDQAEQIEQLVGVEGNLIEELNQELAANQIQIQADPETGAIVFESAILFAKDSNELIDEGKEFFRKFMPVYLEVLLRPEFKEYIAEIIIEGHTDDTGSYLHNLELSQERARSVAEYFLSDDCDFLEKDTIEKLQSLITVNGCADKAPIYHDDGSVDEDKSRRVEIKFRLKDQEMIRRMDKILNNSN